MTDDTNAEATDEPLRVQCFNARCDKTFDSVDEMVPVAGAEGMSPRHFCEGCSERIRRGPPLTDGGKDIHRDWYLYALALGCPQCDSVFRVVEQTEEAVPIDMEIPLSGYPFCPTCGIHLPSHDEDWDLRSEHQIETVSLDHGDES